MNMKGEIWKDIENYEGYYMVSNMGRIKSLNYRHTGKEGILKGNDNGDGYLQVKLLKDDKGKNYKIHRLVAQAFLDNSNNLPEVNHRDENKQNNCVQNLEWCDRAYNNNYGTRTEKTCKPVFSVDKESGLIMWWQSANEAERCTGINHSNIIKCCQGKRKSVGNHTWFYDDDNE